MCVSGGNDSIIWHFYLDRIGCGCSCNAWGIKSQEMPCGSSVGEGCGDGASGIGRIVSRGTCLGFFHNINFVFNIITRFQSRLPSFLFVRSIFGFLLVAVRVAATLGGL